MSLGVWAFGGFHKYSAQQYYRLTLPLLTLSDLGAHVYLDDGKQDQELTREAMFGADILLGWGCQGSNDYKLATHFREAGGLIKGGEIILPPAFVLDMDDATEYCHPLNPAFASFGVRSWEGEILSPGDSLLLPGRSGDRVLWQDKETRGGQGRLFDIERNIHDLGVHYDIARAASGVSVTTEALAQCYRDQGVENVYVFPNSVRESDYHFPNLAPHAEVRLLWEGGAAHIDSWWYLKAPLLQVLKDHPNVKLVVFGTAFPWMTKEIPSEQFEFHDWVDYAGYKATRVILDCDINLCLLTDGPFTRAKSAIRFYEGSLGPRPEAALASNVGPYREIEDGKTGLLFDTPEQFAEKLKVLIADAELRKTLGSAARQWVLDNRGADKTVPGLLSWYNDIKARQRQAVLATS